MPETQKRPIPLSELAEQLRNQHRLSPALQKIVAQNRRERDGQRETIRAFTRDFIKHVRRHIETDLKLDPAVICQIPDDVVDGLLSSFVTLKACEDIPGAKITFSITSEVTVNGVRVPDEE